MKNCTKHALERWTERVVEITTEKERDAYIRQNEQKLKENMNTTLEYAEFIYKGQIGDNITRNYYIKDNIVFVLNTQNDAIITVYKVDFGFTPEINLQVSKGLIKEIRKLVEEKEKIDFEVLEEHEKIKHEIHLLEQQEAILMQQLKITKERKKFVEEEEKSITSQSQIVELDIKRHTNNLVNSKEYKEDLKTLQK